MAHNNYYNKTYFDWQKGIGEFGGLINLDKFKDFIREEDNVIDFGCGGGYLLKNIKCTGKIGIDINDEALNVARQKNNLIVFKSTEGIEDNWADVIISNNALEHTQNPLLELKRLIKKLKKGGKIICVVPCESIFYKYKPNDINHHLYSWSPMALGNLFSDAGFRVIEVKPYLHKWPPKYKIIYKFFGKRIFNIFCKIYARIENSWYQVRIIAEKD